MSEWGFKYTLLKEKKTLFDFLKVVGDLNMHLRSWWAWIKGFLNALSELLFRAEKFAWIPFFKNSLLDSSFWFPPFCPFYSFKKWWRIIWTKIEPLDHIKWALKALKMG